jgi:hypothetical protein
VEILRIGSKQIAESYSTMGEKAPKRPARDPAIGRIPLIVHRVILAPLARMTSLRDEVVLALHGG